jgi:hypothetical protein
MGFDYLTYRCMAWTTSLVAAAKMLEYSGAMNVKNLELCIRRVP